MWTYENWIHIKCNNLNFLDYRYLQNCDESWYCIECCSKIFPFNSLSSNKKFLACCNSTDSNIIQWKDLENGHASSLSLKPPSDLELLVNQFNSSTLENSNDPEKISSSKYYDIEEMLNIEMPHNNKLLTLFRINTCLIIEILMTFSISWVALKNFFDIIAISETRITKQVSLLNNLNLKGTVIWIEKALINDHLHVWIVFWILNVLTIYNFAVIYLWILLFS